MMNQNHYWREEPCIDCDGKDQLSTDRTMLNVNDRGIWTIETCKIYAFDTDECIQCTKCREEWLSSIEEDNRIDRERRAKFVDSDE